MHHPWLIARDAHASAACNTFLQQHLNIATLNCTLQNAHCPPICALCALCSAQWRVASAGHSGPNYLLHHQCSPRQERKGPGLQLNCSWARRRRGSRWQEQGIVCSPFQCTRAHNMSTMSTLTILSQIKSFEGRPTPLFSSARVNTEYLDNEYLTGAAYLKYWYLISLEDWYGTKFGTMLITYG